MPRLRRADPAKPGWTRRRCGRGFVFLDQHGQRVDASGPNAVGTWSSPGLGRGVDLPMAQRPTSKLSALTRRAAASTCTTRTGAPRAIARSSITSWHSGRVFPLPAPWSPSTCNCRGCLRTGPGHRLPSAGPRWASGGLGRLCPGQRQFRAGHVALRPCEYPRRHGPVAVHRKIRQRTRCRPR